MQENKGLGAVGYRFSATVIKQAAKCWGAGGRASAWPVQGLDQLPIGFLFTGRVLHKGPDRGGLSPEGARAGVSVGEDPRRKHPIAQPEAGGAEPVAVRRAVQGGSMAHRAQAQHHFSHVFLLTTDAAQAVRRDEGAGHDQGEAPEVVWEQVGAAALPACPALLELAAKLGDGDRFITGAVLERAVSSEGHREAGDRSAGPRLAEIASS